jgi:hypothetical protein
MTKDGKTRELFEYGIAKIELGPRDILVIKSHQRLLPEQTARIAAIVKYALDKVGMKGQPFLVIDNQFDIEKVTKQ